MKKAVIPTTIIFAMILTVLLLLHNSQPSNIKSTANLTNSTSANTTSKSTTVATSTSTPTLTPTIVASTPTLTPTVAPTSTLAPTATPTGYKDGNFSGDNISSPYGNVQVEADIKSGKIIDIKIIAMPGDYISSQVSPLLTQEVISAQSANIDSFSGATYTSEAYIQSLQSALSQAQS